MSEKFYYRKICESEIKPKVLKLAEKMLSYCKEKLRLPDDVRIQWIRSVDKNSYELDELYRKYLKTLEKMGSKRRIVPNKYEEFARGVFCGRAHTLMNRNEIEINADRPLLLPDEKGILHTIAHECQHVRDHLDFSLDEHLREFLYKDNEKFEQRAEDFAFKVTREFIQQEGLKLPKD